MKVLYVSPSLLPSRAANSIHVISQSKGFIENGYEIDLKFMSFVKESKSKDTCLLNLSLLNIVLWQTT